MSEEQSENGNSNVEVPEIELIIKVSFLILTLDIAYKIRHFMVWSRVKDVLCDIMCW
jgi:hypothetical protein